MNSQYEGNRLRNLTLIAWGFSASTLRPSSEMRTRPLAGFSSSPAYFRCDFDQATRLLKMLCCPLGRSSCRSTSLRPKRPAKRSVRALMVRSCPSARVSISGSMTLWKSGIAKVLPRLLFRHGPASLIKQDISL